MIYILVISFVTSGFFHGTTLIQFKTKLACDYVAKEIATGVTTARCIAVDDSGKK